MEELCEATIAFFAESDTELSLQVGDRVTVTEHNGQWAYGSKGGMQGWFPVDHVKPTEDNRRAPQGGPPAPPTKPKKVTAAPGGAYNTNNNVGNFSLPSAGGGEIPVRNTGNSAFANNLKNIQSLLSGQGPPSTSFPHDDRGTQGYQHHPSFVPPEMPSPAPPSSVALAQNGYAGGRYNDSGYNNNSSNGFSTQPRANSPLKPPALPPLNIRPPGGNSGHVNRGGGPAVPLNPPPAQNPVSRRGSVPSTPPSPGINKVSYSFQFCVEAQHPYSAQTNGELTFAAREKLDIIERPSPSSGWWRARNKAGEIGLVPATYVKEIPQSTPVLAERLWYLPRIKRDETEHRMRRQPTECFVIRDSEAFPGSFTLSVKGPDKVRHIKVTTVTDGYHVGDKKFHSLDAVVDFYRNSPIYIADDGSYKLLLCKALGNARA